MNPRVPYETENILTSGVTFCLSRFRDFTPCSYTLL